MQNRILAALAATWVAGVLVTPVSADTCTGSFYCYGSSAVSVVHTATRPPPIPPPNANHMRQRNRAQLAARTNNSPAPTAVVRAPVVLRQPVPAPATINTFANRPPPVNRAGCEEARQGLLKRAAGLESQAVLASRDGQQQRSIALFRDAGKMRADAQRMSCR